MIDAGQRVLFICGSLVPGKAGVGDYCRRLAVELTRSGIEVKLVSVSDNGVSELTSATQEELGIAVPVVRIPAGQPIRQQFSNLQAAMDAFAPDLVSLQYVPYSFNKYGIPLDFIRRLKGLRYQGRWHLMFHELWITKFRPGQLPKDMTVAWLQKQSARFLCRTLRPDTIHTNLPVHRDRLRTQSIEALPLPLFANIHPADDVTPPPTDEENFFRIGYFSQLIVERTIPLLKSVDRWLKETGDRKLEIVLLGSGDKKVAEASDLLKHSFPDCRIIAPGFLPADELSAYLYTLKLGISPVDHHLLGKSGTVAAFLVHRVPVAAPFVTEDGPSSFVPEVSRAIIEQFTPDKFAAASQAIRELDVDVISARRIADRFISDLQLKTSTQGPLTASEQAHQ